jgi:hypothetical protein
LATPMKFKTLYGGNHVDCVCVKPLTQRIIRPEDDYRTRLQSEPVPNDGQMYFVMRDPLFKP